MKKNISPGVRLVHQRDLAGDGGPLQLAAKRFVASLTLVLFPLQQFVPVLISVASEI